MTPIPRDRWLPLVPYGDDFLFVDEVLRWDAQGIETMKQYPSSLPALVAHFMNGPKIIPGVFLIEQVCQSSLIWALLMRPRCAGQAGYLGQVRASFHAPIPAGQTVRASITLETLRAAMGFEGEVFQGDGESVACRVSGTVLFRESADKSDDSGVGHHAP